MRKNNIYVCDTETTVYDGQTDTRVWASAITDLHDDDFERVEIHHRLEDTFSYLKSKKSNAIVYYHNLKFDGSFWCYMLERDLGYKQALRKTRDGKEYFPKPKDMFNGEFSYSISDRGQWYRIIIKHANKIIELRDSLKILPFSVKRIGESFCKDRRKLDMEYKGERYPGCKITEEEKKYIKNDVLIPKEALQYLESGGELALTIGSLCLSRYRDIIKNDTVYDYEELYPDLSGDRYLPNWLIGEFKSADEYIRKSYGGGWTYVREDRKNKVLQNGRTFDINSEYPSMMHSDSGNYYPVGTPYWWQGDIPEQAKKYKRYYFVRFKCRFNIKEGKLPFIQIRRSMRYPANTILTTSDYYYNGKYYAWEIDLDGKRKKVRPTMTMTMTEYRLFLEHYDVEDLEILDGCYFNTKIGLFDKYIDHFMKIKMTSKGAKRELAKLYLNNLYGKFGSNDDSSFKVIWYDDNGVMHFRTVESHDKKLGYIPIGSAITAYARNFTIRHAQANYATFCYADTDSLHLLNDGKPAVDITLDDKKLLCWKLENEWDTAIFVRAKAYIETKQGERPLIKCAGMNDQAKLILEATLEESRVEYRDNAIYDGGEKLLDVCDSWKDFMQTRRTISDFKVGLEVPGKLMTKRIKGGTILVETTFKLHPKGVVA